MHMAEYFFETKKLTVGYDGVPLIREISIGIRKGEIVALIGPNGSGKSTILKSITRQLKTIAGTVNIDNQALHGLNYRELAKRMAVVLTERMKPELMTCWDVAASGRYPYTGRMGLLTREDEEKTAWALDTVHAMDIAKQDFMTVSDGQRQRVLLARALCQEPEIIVLDEPTSFLDIRHKIELLSILRQMAREQGLTVIMSLHEIDLAQKIADKVMCVKGEVISHYGTPEQVFGETDIRALYDMDQGAYDPLFGSVELPAPKGEIQALVISSGGTGIPVYRRLQKENVPFCAGILYTNEVDDHLARLLAQDVIEEMPFEPIGDAVFEQAMAMVRHVPRVIDAGVRIGTYNQRIKALLDEAERLGKLERA